MAEDYTPIRSFCAALKFFRIAPLDTSASLDRFSHAPSSSCTSATQSGSTAPALSASLVPSPPSALQQRLLSKVDALAPSGADGGTANDVIDTNVPDLNTPIPSTASSSLSTASDLSFEVSLSVGAVMGLGGASSSSGENQISPSDVVLAQFAKADESNEDEMKELLDSDDSVVRSTDWLEAAGLATGSDADAKLASANATLMRAVVVTHAGEEDDDDDVSVVGGGAGAASAGFTYENNHSSAQNSAKPSVVEAKTEEYARLSAFQLGTFACCRSSYYRALMRRCIRCTVRQCSE